ncbi:MAG TPA: hypothetical protein VF627_01295 [Abditibacterium sp.]|jgi:anti-sigma factor RsiW
MNRLSNEQIIDYLDGTLSKTEMGRVESHLKTNAEDAEMVSDLKMAMAAAQDWHASEPLQVSENFWPQLRENLGPVPKRSVWSSFRKSLSATFGTSPAARFSVGAGVAAIILAMSAFLFAPQNATQPVVAGELSAADKIFVQQSVQKHEAYVKSQPVAGDTSSLETGADEENEPDIP